jgi:hypothetical protein
MTGTELYLLFLGPVLAGLAGLVIFYMAGGRLRGDPRPPGH